MINKPLCCASIEVRQVAWANLRKQHHVGQGERVHAPLGSKSVGSLCSLNVPLDQFSPFYTFAYLRVATVWLTL